MKKPRRKRSRRMTAKGFPRRGHDHRNCVAAAVERAAAVCARRHLQLTPLRRRVLERVWRSHQPVGAYAILASLRRRGKTAAPPTVYRVLDFLLEQGFIHRIASQSAFVGCVEAGTCHAGQFLICGKCGTAAELRDGRIQSALARRAKRLGFEVERQTVEIAGLCPRCRPRRKRSAGKARARSHAKSRRKGHRHG